MHSLTNDELLNQIKEINDLVKKRNNNEATIDIKGITNSTFFDKPHKANISKIKKNDYKIKNKTVISGFYYNLTLQVFIEESNNSLYLLQFIDSS